MRLPLLSGLSAAWKGIAAGVGIVLAVVAIVYGYTKLDDWRQARRQAKLDSAGAHVKTATELAAEADSEQVRIQPAKDSFTVLINRPETKNNPQANKVATGATKIIKADSVTIDKQKKAIAHLDSAVVDLQDAGPPLGPRAVPYGVVGYVASNRQRAVPLAKLGLDYRLLPHVMANLELSYQPPPAGSAEQKPEFRLFVGGKATFR